MKNNSYMLNNYMILAEKFADEDDVDRALDFYNKAYQLREGRRNIELLLDMAVFYDELGKEHLAIEKFKEVIDINPEDARAYYGLAMTFDNDMEYDDAIKLYKKAIELDDKYDRAYFFLANAYDETGEKEKAIESYKKVNELNPEDYWAYVNLGVIYEEQNQNLLAKEATEKALEIEPSHYKALFNMGVILKNLGSLEESKLYYIKAIEKEPHYPYSYLNLGVIFIEEEEYKKAIEVFGQGIDNNPDEASLFYNRACCYAQLQKPEIALIDIIKALEIYPELLEFMKSDKELSSIRDLEAYKKLFK